MLPILSRGGRGRWPLPVGVIEVPFRLRRSKREREGKREDIHTLAKFSIGDSIAWNNLLINYNWNE